MRYEIDKDTLAISVYQDGAVEPFILQPNFPNGVEFADIDEAEKVAEAILLHHKGEGLFPVSADVLYNRTPEATPVVEETND